MPTQGYQRPESFSAHLSAMVFTISQMIGRINSATLVQVMAVSSAGELSIAGTVDVMPLVNQVDGAGGVVPHGTIYGIPYYRAQGGANAIILDPAVGDIGVAVFADHDTSSVIANKGAANPGSSRRFDFSDGMYFGGFLNSVPNQYVQFNANGITISSPQTVTVNANQAIVNASTTATINANTVDINAGGGVNVTTPNTSFSGNITVAGTTTTAALAVQ